MKGRLVAISGASAGVGRAVATRFAKAGARLALLARDSAALQALANEFGNAPTAVAWRAVDVSDATAVRRAVDSIEDELGPIDVWVNDAMVTVFSPIHALTPDEYRRVTEVTYLGSVYATMAVLRHMRARGRGKIVTIGSALAYRGIPLQSAYCGAKHALRAFTASLRSELENENSKIVASIVELPAMNTPQFDWALTHMEREPRPMGTIYNPEVAAEAVWQAVQRPSPELWVGTSTLLTIIGNMIAPAFMDRYLAQTAVAGQQTSVPVKSDRPSNLCFPVTDLHRTRGRFGANAKSRAMILRGGVARYAIVGCGALVFFLLGLAAAALVRIF